MGQAAAARYLHPHDEDGADVVPAEQLRELIDKLERCYKSIIEFQDSKEKESKVK